MNDSDSFAEYATARQAHLRRLAFLLCGDWHDAQDLTQTALMNLCRSWKRAERADSRDAYAHQVVVRAFLSQRRKQLRQQVRAAEFALRENRAGPDIGEPELRLTLLAALAQLAPRGRAVLVLRFWEDLSVEATAEALGCSPGNVKSLTSRTLARLRDILGDSLFEDEPDDDGIVVRDRGAAGPDRPAGPAARTMQTTVEQVMDI